MLLSSKSFIRRLALVGSTLFLSAAISASAADSGAVIESSTSQAKVTWPVSAQEQGELIFNLNSHHPLIKSISVDGKAIATGLNPVTLLTVGNRNLKKRDGWTVFFDNPRKKDYERFAVELGARKISVSEVGNRTTVTVAEATAGSFSGHVRFTFYRHSPLILAETILSTQEDGKAILYDTGLASEQPDWATTAWRDPQGNLQRAPLQPQARATPLAVAGRAIVAEAGAGSLAVFPAPHRFFYPLDEAFNLKFVWHGRNYENQLAGYGIGIRQSLEGDDRWVPWFNAPPQTDQHLGVFYLVSSGDGAQTLDAVAQYTHADRYPDLPGYQKLTSHYHIEHTLEYLQKQAEQNTTGVPVGLEIPGFVKTLKARGVDIVHLAEFHKGKTPKQSADIRLPMLKSLHEECARLSDDELLILPGEEPNVHLGGHWISFFPKPVYWVLNRNGDEPFVEQVEDYGSVYHVGSTADVLRLMELENGLMWTAHPRIKGSAAYPDQYRDTPYFESKHFLGGAWKPMPADLSRPTLGWRVLDLLDDMSNWGAQKQILGEADLFRMEPDFETYAHMNINYLQLDTLPHFEDGWQPVLDTLRGGQFFTTTGEILIPEFSIGGKVSGETLDTTHQLSPLLEVRLEWTFPLAFANVVSGDGKAVYHHRIDLSDTESFGSRTLKLPIDLTGRTWVRFEVWDIATNGAFTQPIWLNTQPANHAPHTGARFVPERKDDFAWENDLIAFRAYGPAVHSPGQKPGPYSEDSGIDCWAKRVPTPIIDKWYANGKYHQDHGEGLDFYKVGSSRGCGGTAIWKDEKMWLSGPFKKWEIISTSPAKTVFELTYEYDMPDERFQEVKRITIELGQQLFRSESTFTQDGKPASVDVAIGLAMQKGMGEATYNSAQGWMSYWDKIEGTHFGTGVKTDPQRITQMKEYQRPGGGDSEMILVTPTDAEGQTLHFAGFGWDKAGKITSLAEWNDYLALFNR